MMRSTNLTVLALAGLTSIAHAHFKLNEPSSSTIQDAIGDPQKASPCGGSVASNAVTNYMPGQMISIKLAETISHPGHYRVALAANQAGLPADPPVTVGATECGSAPIDANPTLPVLADGLFINLVPANGEQTVQVQLPAGMSCPNCVLQVMEFMSSHGAPCFYYHCATVNISATAPDAGPSAGGDAGTTPTPDAGANPGGGATGGCAAAHGAQGMVSIFGMLGVLLWMARWRRTSPRHRDLR